MDLFSTGINDVLRFKVFANSENYHKLFSRENCAVHCQNNLTSPIPKHLKAMTPHISHLSNYTLKNVVISEICNFFIPKQ